jgi:hypothetical protein
MASPFEPYARHRLPSGSGNPTNGKMQAPNAMLTTTPPTTLSRAYAIERALSLCDLYEK